VRIRLREGIDLPLEAPLCPDALAGLSQGEIEVLPVWNGKEEARLGDFFLVSGGHSTELVVSGKTEGVKRLGEGMRGGTLILEGPAGMHTGSRMQGGEILVEGSGADSCGTGMEGGVLAIRGNAGAGLGGAFPGSPRGMTGGLVLVHGSAGEAVGERMRRGLIAIAGNAGRYLGRNMIAGTIVAGADLGEGAGLGMRRGTIVVAGRLDLLPTFRYACTHRPLFLSLVSRSLKARGFRAPFLDDGVFRRYGGDFAGLGRGEVLQWANH
jgi:formylmethanofuran dehydrogenase subunit C